MESTEAQEGGSQEPMSDVEKVQEYQKLWMKYCVPQSTAVPTHKRLSDSALSIIQQVRFRIAGSSPEGERLPRCENQMEYRKFRTIEEAVLIPPETWKKTFEAMGQSGEDTLQDPFEARRLFSEKGGHMIPISEEKFHYVQRHGVVIFSEIEVEGRWIPIGSITAFFQAPFCEYRDRKFLHPVLPNLDIRDIRPNDESRKDIIAMRERTLTIWRTSVINRVSEDLLQELGVSCSALNMQRLDAHGKGYASALKTILFDIANVRGKSLVTFNIGAVKERRNPIILGTNERSLGHNKWMEFMGDREKYHDDIIPDKLRMVWRAYYGSITGRGLSSEKMQARPERVAEEKGWSREKLRHCGHVLNDQLNRSMQIKEDLPVDLNQ